MPPTPLCRKSEGELRDALLKVFPGPDAMTDLLLAADLSFEDFVMPRSDHRANVLHLVQQLNGRGEILRLLDRAHHEVPECKTFGELREEALGREATHLMIALPYARADGLRLVRWATDQVAPMPVTLHPLEETSGDRVIGCDVMMFVATGASVAPDSSCLYQLERAIELGMDVIGVVKDPDVVMPGRIAETMAVDLAGDPVLGRRRLLRHLERLASPDLLMDRLRRQRDRFRRQAAGADARERPWYAAEIEYLSERIDAAESRMADLPATERMVDAAIADGQNKEREPDAAMPERQAVRCPYEPPSVPPKEFQNRIEELQAIERTLADGSARLLVLTGRDGVGKTGMVSRLLYRIRNGPAPPALDAFVYLGTQGHRKLDGGVLLRALLRVVPEQRGVDELADLVHAPVPAVDKLNALLRALGDDRVVVAVDNCETALNAAGDLSDRELRALVHRILDRRDHGVRILISSRRDPLALAEKYAHTRYQSRGEGLSREEAFKLLRAMGGERVRDLPEPSADELYWFHRHTKGLPRAIELAFGELSTPGRSLSWLIGEMDGAGEQDIVTFLFDRVFKRLDPFAKRVVQALAVFGRPVRSTTVDHLLRGYAKGEQSHQVLEHLRRRRLIRGDGDRYWLPPGRESESVLRTIPLGEPEDRAAEPRRFTQPALLHEAAEYFAGVRRSTVSSVEQLHPEFSEIELRIRGGEYAAALAVIERIDDGYLHGWGHSDAVVESLHGLADLDPRRELVRLSLLARALRQQEDHAGVIACVRPALRLATRRRVTTDRVRLIIQLANAYFEQGRLDLATAHYRKAAWLTRTRLRGLRQERAFVHAGLVLCAGRAGHLDRALRHHASALRLLRGTVEESEHRAALYISAAWVEGELGRTDAARVNLHRARSAADAAGDHILLGEAKQAEAEILLDEGGFVAAVALADQAAQAGIRAGNDRLTRASKEILAQAYLCTGDLDGALSAVETAGRERGSPRLYGLAGILQVRLGRPEAAMEAFRTGLKQADEAYPYRNDTGALTARALLSCGVALVGRETADVDDALAALREARAVLTAPGAVLRALRLLAQLEGFVDDELLNRLRRATR